MHAQAANAVWHKGGGGFTLPSALALREQAVWHILLYNAA